ncbi:hypothetical protein TanjilG_24814 [Lupinus angustifolius]|uniref:Uncharacterized protein n=1 Tax=Lupinus angustifolius TaxID=3871 RepID=A0A4P1RKT8_LUPAN|nr:hypothetical protein TanjilG_24814 [Lupinus angustifolius]
MDIEYTFWQMLHLCTSPKVVLLLTVATLAYCAAYDHSTAHALFVVFSVLLFHFLLTGVFLATFCWFLTNAYLREEAPNSYVVEQRVECYPLFPVPSIGGSWFRPRIVVQSTIHVLPFLERTTFFLYPIGVVMVLSPILILSGFNPSRYLMSIYFSRQI